MRSISFLLILAAVVACSALRDRLEPQRPTPPAIDRALPEATPVPAVSPPDRVSADNKDARTISGGVLNGTAISLPQPVYPAAARAVHASGQVTVQVTVGTAGFVESATAASGHPLLRAASVAAAREARFAPRLLGGKPVKVSGVITYDFPSSDK